MEANTEVSNTGRESNRLTGWPYDNLPSWLGDSAVEKLEGLKPAIDGKADTKIKQVEKCDGKKKKDLSRNYTKKSKQSPKISKQSPKISKQSPKKSKQSSVDQCYRDIGARQKSKDRKRHKNVLNLHEVELQEVDLTSWPYESPPSWLEESANSKADTKKGQAATKPHKKKKKDQRRNSPKKTKRTSGLRENVKVELDEKGIELRDNFLVKLEELACLAGTAIGNAEVAKKDNFEDTLSTVKFILEGADMEQLKRHYGIPENKNVSHLDPTAFLKVMVKYNTFPLTHAAAIRLIRDWESNALDTFVQHKAVEEKVDAIEMQRPYSLEPMEKTCKGRAPSESKTTYSDMKTNTVEDLRSLHSKTKKLLDKIEAAIVVQGGKFLTSSNSPETVPMEQITNMSENEEETQKVFLPYRPKKGLRRKYNLKRPQRKNVCKQQFYSTTQEQGTTQEQEELMEKLIDRLGEFFNTADQQKP